MPKRKSANKAKGHATIQKAKALPRGYSPRGKTGMDRAKLAIALGAASDRALLNEFPPALQKPVSKILQGFHLASSRKTADTSQEELLYLLKNLLDALAKSKQETKQKTYKQQKFDANLRQVIAHEMANIFTNMPFILSEENTSEAEKLEKLKIYIEAMEDIYEILDLEWIGEIGAACKFDALLFESKDNPSKGDNVVIRKPGLRQGERIVKKAIVEARK